jgi:hypothetical protein
MTSSISSATKPAASADTMWSTTQSRKTTGGRYHGFSKYGDTGISYCGIEFGGLKRMTPPDRDAAVCEHCATACGFTRRPGRTRSRKRGSRNLGTSAERMERVLDQMEEIQALQSRVAELEDEVEALKDVYEE